MAAAASVTANVLSGYYTTVQTVTLSTTETTGEIYYTLDGTTPTSAKTKYTAPLVLATGTENTLKAVTVAEGMDDSAVTTLYIVIAESFLAKIRRSVRRNTSTDVDAELTDIIAECREDLLSIGIVADKANSETDSLILGAVRCFARWKFGLSNEDADKNRDDYMQLRDELRRKGDYISYAITFVCKASNVAVADVAITFNGETKETDAAGTAVFYYVSAGVNQEYTVIKSGYVSQAVDLDVTATATVNVALVAS
jgi:hypothetical protein